MKGCHALTCRQIQEFLAGFRGTFAARNRALAVLGLTTGARISELLSLDISDVITDEGDWRDDVVFQRRHTKGRHQGKRKPLYPVAREALEPWLHDLRYRGGVWRWTPLFCTRSLRRMSRFEAYKALRAALRNAGLRLSCWGTHTMRKTFARAALTDLMERRAAGEAIEPLLELQRVLDHRDLSSTVSYTETLGAGQQTMDTWADRLRNMAQNQKT